jgi:hypothetical protein
MPIFFRYGMSRSTIDSPPSATGFGSKPGVEGSSAIFFLSSVSATATGDVAQFRGLVALTRPALLLLPAMFIAGAPRAARAEGERALSVGLGWATFSTPGEPTMDNMEPAAVTPTVGGSLAAIYEHAIGSDFSLRGELAAGLFYGGETEDGSALSYAGLADVGAVFRFDVLKYVPYAFGGVGAVVTTGGPINGGTNVVLAIGGGLDVLVDRSKSWGIEARLASFGGDVTMFTLGLRATTRWGYF